MLRRLANLPFRLATRAARAYQEHEDARTKAQYGTASDPADVPVSDRVGNAADLVAIDPVTCRIDALDAVRMGRGSQSVAFVDMRARPGATGIPGATHLPLQEANVRVSELPPDVPVLVYCDDGGESARGVAFFRERGMEDTWWIAGGLPAWVAAGGAVAPTRATS